MPETHRIWHYSYLKKEAKKARSTSKNILLINIT